MKKAALGFWYRMPRHKEYWNHYFNTCMVTMFSLRSNCAFHIIVALLLAVWLTIARLKTNFIRKCCISVFSHSLNGYASSRSLCVKKHFSHGMLCLGSGDLIHHVVVLYAMEKSTMGRFFCDFVDAILKHLHTVILVDK